MVFGITCKGCAPTRPTNSFHVFARTRNGLIVSPSTSASNLTMFFVLLLLAALLTVTQVSRIALRGNCLFSAGHDGQVNHYVVSYSGSSFGMVANAEQNCVATPGRQASGECTVPSSSETVDLTIVTTYATAPVTTVSELWVGGDGNWEAGPKRAARGSKGQVRVAVAGRSGSSRMSVWDLTEGRQIFEVRLLCFQQLSGRYYSPCMAHGTHVGLCCCYQ